MHQKRRKQRNIQITIKVKDVIAKGAYYKLFETLADPIIKKYPYADIRIEVRC